MYMYMAYKQLSCKTIFWLGCTPKYISCPKPLHPCREKSTRSQPLGSMKSGHSLKPGAAKWKAFSMVNLWFHKKMPDMVRFHL